MFHMKQFNITKLVTIYLTYQQQLIILSVIMGYILSLCCHIAEIIVLILSDNLPDYPFLSLLNKCYGLRVEHASIKPDAIRLKQINTTRGKYQQMKYNLAIY
jgi:hypothetical protein